MNNSSISLTVHLHGGVRALRVLKDQDNTVSGTILFPHTAVQVVNLNDEQINAMPSAAWFRENKIRYKDAPKRWASLTFPQRAEAHAQDWCADLRGTKVEINFFNN